MERTMPNVGTAERVARVAGGGFLVGAGLAFIIRGAGSLWVGALDVATVALGIDFLITGVTGRCPLYRWLGWSTAPQRGR